MNKPGPHKQTNAQRVLRGDHHTERFSGDSEPPAPPRLVLRADPSRDYIAIADAYARDAVADKGGKRFCRWVRLAAERYRKDRKRALRNKAPFRFDPDEAVKYCRFIERLPHVEGKWETPNITLHPAHVFFVVSLFGFRNLDGGRRFSSALFAVARKNAKSTLAAAILLACLCLEDEPGPQAITAATTGIQARIVYNIAKRMVEIAHDLRQEYGLETYANAITRVSVWGNLKPINSKASTQDGLNPSVAVLDEIHAHKAHDLINVLQSAAGARSNPLWLYTTTEGYESPGPWPELRHFAKQILLGSIEADHFLAVIYALDEQDKVAGIEEDDDFDESRWVKANPLIEANPILLREIRKAAIEAKQMPGRHAEFKIKRLNRQSASSAGWGDLIRWNKCDGKVDLDALVGAECFAGLDLSSNRDLTSFRLAWNVEDRYFTYGRRFVPADAVRLRGERGLIPYPGWVARGDLIETPGDVVDYALVEEEIIELWERFTPREIAYDPWNASEIVTRLKAKGLPMVPFIQGAKSYHPAMQELERAYIAGRLSHGGDAVLKWCFANLVARKDPNNNLAPDKQRSPEKIDDACALLMAIGARLRNIAEREPEKDYGVVFV